MSVKETRKGALNGNKWKGKQLVILLIGSLGIPKTMLLNISFFCPIISPEET